MKIKHKYNNELESKLIRMEDDEFFEWLKENEVEWSDISLNEQIMQSLTSEVNCAHNTKE
jgi:hypothetical protein